MFRVLQNLPQRLFKSYHGGVYWANRGQPVAESQRKKHQDKIIVVSFPSHELGASLHTSSRLEKVGHQGSSDEEWQRSFKQRIEWDSFRRSSYASEALGWGSIIVLGLQLGRFISTGPPGEKQRRGHERLLSSIAHVLPCPYSSRHVSHRRSILPEEEASKKRSHDMSQSSSDESSSYLLDESPYWDFKPSDVQPGGLQKTSNEKPSPPSSVSPTTQVPSFNQSSDSSFPSSSSIPTGIPPPSAGESKVPFDQVTRQCWGRVNNIIGGHLMSEGDEEKAVHHFKIASQSGYSKGQYNLGMCYELGKGVLQDDVQAAVFFGLAAEQGHSHAQYKLGTYHLDGRGNVKQCEQTALTLIAQAAEGGVVQAQSYLGMYYMTSEEPDPQRAVAYLQEAAHKKDAEAQYHLGLCYEYGWGVETNEARASSLYHSAASKDHAPSLYSLALLHEQGLGGLPENQSHAKELFIRSSSLGYEKATEKLLEMDAEERGLHRFRLDSNSTLSSDSWTTSSESGSETTGGSGSLFSPFSSSSIDSDISICFDAGAPMCLDLKTLLPPASGNIHVSSSAPELNDMKRVSDLGGGGDRSPVNSILHSLSCLTFSTLHEGSKVKGQSDGEWMLGTRRLTFGMSGGQDSGGSEKVVFQLGCLDEEENIDWCEPIDAIAQQRLVSFKRSTVVL
ncbi:DAP3-binding cell death enhancer 1-like [Lytechinus pictus]|uniref:DAP3-binding cell death enhancer 1-like n=1 Tax=Lytechinus pictus TaxID=7653 RepID=UPI0030B9ADEB